jgi:hypothetical protein
MKRALAAAAVALSPASIAAAADYPFSGFYAANFDRVGVDKAQLLCAYNFFIQEKDGSFINYHIDLPRFRERQSVRFLEYARGHCYADTDLKIETCIVTSDTDPTQKGKMFVDVYKQVGPEAIEIRFFDDANQAAAFARDGTGGDGQRGEYDLCAGFDRTSMADYLSTEHSTLSPDQREKFVAPKLDAETTATMTLVLEAIRNGKNKE